MLHEIVGADAVHLSADVLGSETIAYRRDRSPQSLEASLVADLAREGIPTLVYTVNDHGKGSLAENLAAIGVAGLFTDNPAEMITAFRKLPPNRAFK